MPGHALHGSFPAQHEQLITEFAAAIFHFPFLRMIAIAFRVGASSVVPAHARLALPDDFGGESHPGRFQNSQRVSLSWLTTETNSQPS